MSVSGGSSYIGCCIVPSGTLCGTYAYFLCPPLHTVLSPSISNLSAPEWEWHYLPLPNHHVLEDLTRHRSNCNQHFQFIHTCRGLVLTSLVSVLKLFLLYSFSISSRRNAQPLSGL
ncbi:hypothetical protein EDB92DRAFT_1541315 [Lactarius akahatsu]|uniref:Uncharacterized protein n=1 Tax=Lactarius akahatsu TaxID=416441 RepID=A0AAD4Q9U7_9AGAM|nr:hypothetical protein EDB92DRAFT_1541315 [Lactarius akahatsu]